MDYIAQPKDYWIATNAINITRNALGNPNRTQGSVASGAAILCYIEGVDGLGYDNGHRFRTWPLTISPTYFNSNTEKYVYVAIPRSAEVGTQAVVVFPSEKLDIYGVNANDEQVGSTDYYYIWLQGILTATDGTSNREWQQAIDFGKKGTDEDLYDDTTGDWYQYSKVSGLVTFLKDIAMKAGTTFHNLILGYKELTGVATSDIAYTDSDTLVATPGYVESQYLSKTHESEAQEQIGFLKGLWIGTKNLYEITADGIAKLKSVIAEDVNSQRVQTGEIKSPNYTGDSVTDTGFLLTNNYNGHSKLTIDEIYVRMKAVFESLEVRERTYTGGDQIWSCAGNRISRVDYLGNVETADHVPQMMNVHADGRIAEPGDEEESYSVPVPGDTYGYSDIKVPWLLRAVPLLARAKVFARYRKVRIVINEPAASSANRAAASESPLANIRRARCYFLAKDDDMEVHNWWRINDLARCQTMNLANTTRQTYLSGEDQKVGNIFWWRKVIGVSYEPVKLDDGKEYHYFDVAFDYLLEQEHPEEMAISVMEGSDIPAASDSVVQFGNTIIEGRMNLMMMEVNGGDAVGYSPTADAPCLKAYRGVYCFDLSKCWVGGNPRKMMLSPKSGYEFYGPNFKQVTEYDVVPVPVDRGLWLNITPTRDDYREHAMVRKCYYYDKVSHNGSYWLCSIVDGAHWADGNGDYISDAAYSALTEEQKALCSRKQNYTIDEPSANSIDWTEVVQKGDKGDNMIRLDINNEMDMIPTTAALRIDVARTVETTVRLFDGATEVDISSATLSSTGGPASSIATASQAADGKGKKLSWAFKAGQTMAEAYDITISYTYKNVAYTAVFTVSASKGEAVWQLKPSMSAIPFQRNADNTLTPASRAVGLSLVKIDGGSTATYTSVQTGLTVRYSTSSMPSSASAGTGWSSGDITVANTADNLYIAMFNASAVLLDRETIPVVKDGENGSSAVRLDISNEMDMIPTTSALRIDVARTVETTVRLFDGATEVDISAATLSPSGGPASSIATFSQAADGKGKKLSWAFKAGQTMAEAYDITISYTYKNVAYTAVFTVSASKGEAVWQLKPSMSAIPFQRNADNTLTPASREVGLSLVKIDGGSTAIYTSVQTGLTVRYSTSSMPSSASAGTGWSSGDITVANTADNLYIAMFNASGVLLDRETIPVIKDGAKGETGDAAPYYVDDYGIGASRTTPSDISSWSSSQPSPTAQKPYVWKRTRLYNPNTQTYGNATYVCLTGEQGEPGGDGYGLSLTPTSLILESMISNNQEVVNYVNNIVTVRVMKGSTPVQLTCSVLTGTSSHSSNISISSSNIPVNNAGTYSTVTLAGGINLSNGESGFFTVRVSTNDGKFSQDVRINFYVNRAATFAREIKNGIETAMGAQTVYDYDELGNVIKTAYQADIQTSAKGLTQQFTEQISRAGATGGNLFGFHKDVVFDTYVVPFIQGYGFVCNNHWNASDKTGRIWNLGMHGRLGYYTVKCLVKTSNSAGYVRLQMNWHDAVAGTQVSAGIKGVVYATTSEWRELTATFLFNDKNEDHIGTMVPEGQSGSYVIGDINGYIDIGQISGSNNETRIGVQNNRIYVRHLKVEYKDIATDFCEADEDVAYLGQGNVAKNLSWNPYNANYDSYPVSGTGRDDAYRVYVNLNQDAPWGYDGDNPRTSWDYINQLNVLKIKAGRCYTLSFWAKSSTSGFVITQYLFPNIITDIGSDLYVDASVGTIREGVMSDGCTNIQLSTAWKQYFVHFYAAVGNGESDNYYVNVIPLRIIKDLNGTRSGYVFMSDIELQEGYVTSAEYFASFISQNARRISLVQQSGTKLAGIDIQNGVVNLMGDRVVFTNSTGTISGKVWIDPNDGSIHASDGHFSGEVNATSGTFYNVTIASGDIGGFTVDTDRLYNNNFAAGIDIDTSDGKHIKIGKNAEGVLGTEDAILRAESTKAKSTSSTTYNTTLYLNAAGAKYNYAFYGNGNGVLDGLVFGFRTQHIVIPSGSSNITRSLVLQEGSHIILDGSHTSGNILYNMPTLGDICNCLGIPFGSSPTKAFAIEIDILNLSGYGFLYIGFKRSNTPSSAAGDLPVYFDNDGNVHYDRQLAQHDYIKILLVYNANVGYRAYIIVYNT